MSAPAPDARAAALREVQAAAFAHLGRLTPLSWEGRLRRFARALTAATDLADAPALAASEQAAVSLADHANHRRQAHAYQFERARMALRLARWLRTPEIHEGSFAQLAERYRDDVAWVDRARDALAGGDDLADIDMLIGADFFLSHHVYWSNATHRMFFTFNGGHVFDLRYLRDDGELAEQAANADAKPAADDKAASAQSAPTDAEGFSRRGAARAVRGDVTGAFADYDQAIKLAPDNIEYLRQRAGLYARTRQPLRAVEDITHLLKLKPDDVDALMMRAEMRLRLDHKADIRSDLDAAAAAAPKPSDRRLALAGLYEAMEDYPQSIAQYDLWIAAHPDDNRRPMALNGRCWARALANMDLSRALKDCNSALSAVPHTPAYLDSRGLVRLRMGDYAHAIADYDEVLAANGKTAWSLYGRGIARLRLGQKEAGEADIAKAREVQPDLPEEAKKRGIEP